MKQRVPDEYIVCPPPKVNSLTKGKKKRKDMPTSKKKERKCKNKKYRHQWDSNPQSLPPESNALPLGHGAFFVLEE
jgi:hypothetical protein